MNNKIPKDSILRKKGFYAALYSCVGILLVIAAVMSLNNYSQAKKMRQESEQSKVDFSQLEGASVSNDPSYLTPDDRASLESAAKKPEATPAATPAPSAAAPSAANSSALKPTETAKPAESAKPAEKAKPAETAKPAESAKPVETAKPATTPKQTGSPTTEASQGNNLPESGNNTVSRNEESATVIEPIAPVNNSAVSASSEEESWPLVVDESYLEPDPVETKPVFNEFAEGKHMKWPLVGEILMDFSSDHAIYDKTLDQYRTNSNICISSELGAQVRASAEGVVKTVAKTVEKGNMVVIDNGNGWQTIYSQLQDGILVSEGDVVKEGQVIGGVASPSIYGVLLGNHLEFAITKDDAPIDPKDILLNN